MKDIIIGFAACPGMPCLLGLIFNIFGEG